MYATDVIQTSDVRQTDVSWHNKVDKHPMPVRIAYITTRKSSDSHVSYPSDQRFARDGSYFIPLNSSVPAHFISNLHSHPHHISTKVNRAVRGSTFGIINYRLQYSIACYRKPLYWLFCKTSSLPTHSMSSSASQSPRNAAGFA